MRVNRPAMLLAAANKSAVRFSCFLVAAIFVLMIIQRGGARPFPERKGARMILSSTLDHDNQKRENLFSKYFNGVTVVAPAPSAASANGSGVDEGIEDSMRRVPSCPDPLHN